MEWECCDLYVTCGSTVSFVDSVSVCWLCWFMISCCWYRCCVWLARRSTTRRTRFVVLWSTFAWEATKSPCGREIPQTLTVTWKLGEHILIICLSHFCSTLQYCLSFTYHFRVEFLNVDLDWIGKLGLMLRGSGDLLSVLPVASCDMTNVLRDSHLVIWLADKSDGWLLLFIQWVTLTFDLAFCWAKA